jgi:soluble lytic murein transglycosylase
MLGRYRDSTRAWSDPIGRALFRLHLRPNHLTMLGFGVSLLAAAAFIAGQIRSAGLLLVVAGFCDLFDGALARVSGQATAFGAFLDSVIDRYSDLVVLLGIVVFFARQPHTRGALVAMAGLVGSVMVSYTKARAESIGVDCTVGLMERPERLICLIAGAVLGLLEPALWVLAVLANVTALQRIAVTRRIANGRRVHLALTALLAAAALGAPGTGAAEVARPPAETVRVWAAAVVALQQGDPEPVARELATDAALAAPIGDHLRLLLADALARRGDLDAARAYALGVAERHPASRVAPRALVRAATLASAAGDEAAAQAALTRLLAAYPDAPEVAQALYLVGESAEARGQAPAAALAYRQLILLTPSSGWADGAMDRLGVLAAAGTPMAPLSPVERVERAERLLRGGVPKAAADEAERLAAETREPGLLVRAWRIAAEGAARLGRYETAARALEIAGRHASGETRTRLLLDQARWLARAGQRGRAIALYAQIARAGESAGADVAEARFEQARLLDESDRRREAVSLYRALVTEHPAREVAAAALWRLGWLAWLDGDARAAANEFARLAHAPGGRGYRPAALYWRARGVEQVQGRAAAAPLYGHLLGEAPRSYYGMLAARRTGPLPGKAQATTIRLPADPDEAIGDDPGWARVDLLRRVGLIEDALAEVDEVVGRSVADPVRLYGLASAYVREERYHLALRVFRRHLAGFATTGDPALPRAYWEMLYPFGWRAAIDAAARRAGLDPFLVAAVVREESSYDPRAVSRAGARGLMQLMPGTAQPLAAARGWPLGGGALLDDPRANLEMGTAFLAGLIREFSDPRLALAAYNAGPGRARAWWQARRTNDLETWVEQIPFDETRRYVKRVLLSWEEYRRVYGE